ncbi:MAG TPA: hypothetical protein ENG42_02025 [Candidatus Aenigmarchaeota archaeon]|nr:MAG: hypothetical protein DRP03_03435 [Candidatus Aenigmarchaeota archaeon]HDD46225.1 hypothetical protein [Candidatus Aenigmarchaeota archaeon]
MIKITLDSVLFNVGEKHPVIKYLKELEKEGKVKLYSIMDINSKEILESIDLDTYDEFFDICFPGAKRRDISVYDHADLFLLVNHLQAERHFFLTAQKDKLVSFGKAKMLEKAGVKVRVANERFLKELRAAINNYDKI